LCTRTYLARLILHARENLEQQAAHEGRQVRDVWRENAGEASRRAPVAR
jgi:hypothetical protein